MVMYTHTHTHFEVQSLDTITLALFLYDALFSPQSTVLLVPHSLDPTFFFGGILSLQMVPILQKE